MHNPYIKDFPILENTDNKGNRLVYLDSASTSQKPEVVINTVSDYYRNTNANIHRGAYLLSVKSTEEYEDARESVRRFINAEHKEEIVFTKGTTESVNLIAYTYGEENIKKGDRIVLSILEHHSNLIPWQQLAIKKEAELIYMYTDDEGRIPKSEYEKINEKTKIVGITSMSNALGVLPDIKSIIEKAHDNGAVVLVDAAQSVAHQKTDVREINADFLVFSGHKMLAPMGVGVLYCKKNILNKLPPFLFGGDMVEYVEEQSTSFAPIPQIFEGGTQNVSSVLGLGAAINYLEKIGMDNISKMEEELTSYALKKMMEDENIIVYGPKNTKERGGVISFTIKDVHPHDIASILDAEGNVSVRSGHHCAQPLMKHLGIASTCRVSFYLYNTKSDIDILINSLKKVRGWLGYES